MQGSAGGWRGHPTVSSTVLSCPFCHNPHSTALPSPKCYDKRYEGKVYTILTRTSYPRGHGGPGMWRCRTQAVSPVSVLMVNIVLTRSQRDLRASLTSSVSILMGKYS